jgi:DNA-binding transcriptional ArsR family regulator
MRARSRPGTARRSFCAGLDMARQSVSKHLAVLEAADVVTTVWRGREKLHYLNAAPINAIAERWINKYDRQRARALADLLGMRRSRGSGNQAFSQMDGRHADPIRPHRLSPQQRLGRRTRTEQVREQGRLLHPASVVGRNSHDQGQVALRRLWFPHAGLQP